jgi:hypothetical protein
MSVVLSQLLLTGYSHLPQTLPNIVFIARHCRVKRFRIGKFYGGTVYTALCQTRS